MLKFKFPINFYLKIFFSVLLLIGNIGFVFAVETQTTLEQALPGAPEAVGGPAEYIYYLFKYGLMLIGALALGALVFGGFLYIASAGNQQRTQLGKDVIFGAISGLLLLLGTYLILYIINPDLTQLKEIRLQAVNINVPKGLDNVPADSLKPCDLVQNNCGKRTCIKVAEGKTQCSSGEKNTGCNKDTLYETKQGTCQNGLLCMGFGSYYGICREEQQGDPSQNLPKDSPCNPNKVPDDCDPNSGLICDSASKTCQPPPATAQGKGIWERCNPAGDECDKSQNLSCRSRWQGIVRRYFCQK